MRMAMIVGTENEIPSTIVSGTAIDRAMPISVPRTMPTIAPNDRHDDRFPSNHSPGLTLRHADGAHQADLPSPFEHRQPERDRDPEHGDDDGEPEQHGDDHEELVDLRRLGVLELVGGLDLDLRVLDEGILDRLARFVLAHAVGRLQGDEEVALFAGHDLGQHRRGHQPVAHEVGVAVDAGDRKLSNLSVLERRLDASNRPPDRGRRPDRCARRCHLPAALPSRPSRVRRR